MNINQVFFRKYKFNLMKEILRKFLKYLAKLLAGYYWAYIKPELDKYVLDTQRTKFSTLGKSVKFKGSGTIYHPEFISICDHVHIGENYFLMGIGGIKIGQGTIISRNVCLHSGNHNFKANDFLPFNTEYDRRMITIGRGVWIGQNVNVLPGVTIGDGAIIGMGVTLAKNVGAGEIIVNSANRSLGFRDMEALKKLVDGEFFISKHYSDI